MNNYCCIFWFFVFSLFIKIILLVIAVGWLISTVNTGESHYFLNFGENCPEIKTSDYHTCTFHEGINFQYENKKQKK